MAFKRSSISCLFFFLSLIISIRFYLPRAIPHLAKISITSVESTDSTMASDPLLDAHEVAPAGGITPV